MPVLGTHASTSEWRDFGQYCLAPSPRTPDSSRPKPVVQISHRERLLLSKAADGTLRSGLSGKRPIFGRSTHAGQRWEAGIRSADPRASAIGWKGQLSSEKRPKVAQRVIVADVLF